MIQPVDYFACLDHFVWFTSRLWTLVGWQEGRPAC